MTAPSALVDVRDLHAGVSYPGHLLEGCETALILFAAGFLGRQDAVWIAEAGLRAWCVDLDQEKLDAMQAMYPEDWWFVRADVYEYGRNFDPATTSQWDVVSLDPWTNQFDECAARINLWCSLARRLVVLGTGHDTKVVPPSGWAVTDVRKRSDHNGGVFWTCLEPV